MKGAAYVPRPRPRLRDMAWVAFVVCGGVSFLAAFLAALAASVALVGALITGG